MASAVMEPAGYAGQSDRRFQHLQDGMLTVHFHLPVRQRCLHPNLALEVSGPGGSKTIPKAKNKEGYQWFGENFYITLGSHGALPAGTPESSLRLTLKEGCDTFGEAELKYSEIPESKEVWVLNDCVLLKEPDPRTIAVGDLHQQKARAHWLSERLIVLRFDWGRSYRRPQLPMHFWTRPESDDVVDAHFQFFLHASENAENLEDRGSDGVQGGAQWKLLPQKRLAPEDLTETNVPFLAGALRLLVPEEVNPRELCQRQLAVSIKDSDGKPVDCTGLQIGPVVDELFAYDGPLGCQPVHGYEDSSSDLPGGSSMEFALWAPTAVSVELVTTEDPRQDLNSCQDASNTTSKVEVRPMMRRLRSADDGVWRCRSANCQGKFYAYRVYAYHPLTGRFQSAVTPDPYSTACAADSSWSLACHLPTWKEVLPSDLASWRDHSFLPQAEDAAIYELHVRDFSMSDQQVPSQLRGKYLAFAEAKSVGSQHLDALAESGVSHVQLLPVYDFGSVPERAADRIDPPWMAVEAADSEEPQEAIAQVAEVDSFNWGYDPVLYNVPEGSYATNPDDGSRIKEFREMVAALHKKKLGVVMDVVFNHTLGSGPENPKSVLDKCVPGYYHRRAEDGTYEHSTCANNTATERYMMARLVCDSVLHWVTQYQVDGFRFDLMGHITLKLMRKVRDLLDSLTVEMYGFDGRRIMLYGEGWEFGEVANGQRGRVAVQQQLAGTKIGAFNDRIRDATLGGSPFTDPRLQSFATALLMRQDAGLLDQGTVREQEARLRKAQDTIRISLAGSLKDFSFQNFKGETLPGDKHFNEGLAYTKNPVEAINYVSAHDNETLFDNTVWKMLPGCFTPAERMRGNWLATSLVALAHGVPFFHAGDELLRSKSLDRDSYNSGDWFNVLDFSGEKSSFGVGLPPRAKNSHHWDMMRPILRESEVRPTVDMVRQSKAKFLELLQLRRSTALIGLKDAKDIKEKVNFPGCGPLQKLGLVIMQICNDQEAAGKPMTCDKFARVVIVFWAGFETARVSVPRISSPRLNGGRLPLRLHPLQQTSEDSVTRGAHLDGEQLIIPPQTTAVFVEPLTDTK